MLAVASDHTEAGRLVLQIAQLCSAHGAQWHPDLQVEVYEGSLRLLAPPGTKGELIIMPTELLVPIAGAQWADSFEQLDLLTPPESASAVQEELLQLHIALYNATGKLRWWSQQHAARLVEETPAVADAVAPLKPSFQRKHEQNNAAEGFLSTRSFLWKQDPDPDKRLRVLMPIIDLFNHHHHGAPFHISKGAMHMQSAQVGGSECYAHYGHRRDVLDLALHYGYCDDSTPFAHSAPLDIPVDGIGRIRIEHQGTRAPIHPFDPPQIKIEDDGLRISHLCCHMQHPERVATMLRLALQGSLQYRGHSAQDAARLAEQGLEAVVAENIKLLQQLQQAAEKSLRPAGLTLAGAAQRQAAIINAMN